MFKTVSGLLACLLATAAAENARLPAPISMKLMYQVPGYASNSGFCFIYLFVLFVCLFICLSIYLFICLSVCLFVCLFVCLSVLFISFVFHFILFIRLYRFHFCLSLLFYFIFIFIFDSKVSQPNHTKPHLPTYVLNFPSFVCVCVCV